MAIVSNNFNVDSKGNMTCNNGKFTGGNISLGGSQTESRFNITGKVSDWGSFGTRLYPHSMDISKNIGSDTDPSWYNYIRMATVISHGLMQGEIFLGSDNSSTSTFLQANGISTPSLTQTSLESQKKNFEKLQNALNIIKNVDIYKYNLKSEKDTDKKHIGFVIGDNYKYSEELTSKENDGADIYSLASCCLQAIKEQQQIIESLQKEIKELKESRN